MLTVFALGVALLLAEVGFSAEPAVGPLLLKTGSGEPLVSLDLLLTSPAGAVSPEFILNFGFATDETRGLSDFPDSLSLTLQNPSGSKTALLLTTDLTGLQVAPPSQGAGIVPLDPSDIHLRPLPSSGLTAGYALASTFSLAFQLPPGLMGGAVRLFVDLFDNQNGIRSLAFIDHWSIIDAAGPSTNTPPAFVELETAGSVEGGYALESHARHDSVRRRVTLDRLEETRFFRSRAELPVQLSPPRLSGDRWVFDFELRGILITLRSAPDNVSPFVTDTGAVIDLIKREARTARPAASRVYQFAGNVPVAILSVSPVGNELLIRFEYRPQALALESSTQIAGPFSREGLMEVALGTQQISVPRFGASRFYRLVSDQPLRITRIATEASLISFDY